MSKQPKQSSKTYLTDLDIFKSYSNSFNLNKAEFLQILRTFIFLLVKSIIDEGKVYSLPKNLGKLGVIKILGKGKKVIDYNHYNKTGEKVYMKNHHSSGYFAKFYWMTDWPRFNIGDTRINNLYEFKVCRTSSRYLAKQIKEFNAINRYYEY